MIMVPDGAECAMDIADMGLVEHGGPADLLVSRIHDVHCASPELAGSMFD
jgi:hypothetical protein